MYCGTEPTRKRPSGPLAAPGGGLDVCMDAWMHACMYACVCVCVYIYIYIYIYVYVYIYIYIKRERERGREIVYKYMNIYEYVYVYTYICIYVYMHTHVYMPVAILAQGQATGGFRVPHWHGVTLLRRNGDARHRHA